MGIKKENQKKEKEMRKALVLLLCALAVFAIVSCKQDPPAPEKCIVSFNSEGGSAIAPISVEKGAKIEEPADPIRVGSYFCGWYTESTYENEYDFSAAVEKSFALYAKWEEGTIYGVMSLDKTSADGNKYDKFIVSFPDAKVGPGDVVSITFRTTEPFKQYSIRRYGDNKKFFHEKSSGTYPQFFTDMVEGEDGWTTITYIFPEEGAATQDKEASKYPEGGIGFNVYFRNQKMIVGTYMELKAVAINGEEYPLTEKSVNPEGDLGNVNAYFEVLSWLPHEVTFDTAGGTEIPSVTVPYGQRVAKPADPEKADVLFYGWYADKEFKDEFDFDTRMILDDTTVYAKYAPPATVTFSTGEGGPLIEPVTVPAGYTIDEPATPKKEGYLFGGWFTDDEFTEEFDFDDAITEDITLYAQWLYVYVVTLNINDGTGATKVAYAPKDTGKLSADDLRVGIPGYFFGGWFAEAACTTPFDVTADITADTEIYAKWIAPTKEYKLTATCSDAGKADRFQLRFKKSSFDFLDNFKPGDIVTFMVKFTPVDGESEITRFRVRGASAYGATSDFSGGITTEDAGNGWIAVTCVFPEDATYSENGLLMDVRMDEGKFVAGDILEVKAIAFNGREIAMTDSSSSGPYEGVYPTFAEVPILQ